MATAKNFEFLFKFPSNFKVLIEATEEKQVLT
jgi:hypothetical protein